MKQKIVKWLKESRLLSAFMQSPLPSWIVFFVDTIVFFCALTLIFFCNVDTTKSFDGWQYSTWSKIGFLTVLAVIWMYVFKPYKSIVRLSAFEDTYRLAKTVTCWFVCAIIFEFVIRRSTVDQIHYFGLWNLLTTSFVVFSFLVTIRIAVKSLFTILAKSSNTKRRVVVFGSVINSFGVASALLNETEGQFKPVLILSLTHKTPAQIGDIPILPFNPDDIKKIFFEYDCDTVLFLEAQMEYVRNGIADAFLKEGIKMLVINQVEELQLDNEGAPKISGLVQNINIEDLLGREPIKTDKSRVKSRIQEQVVMITGAAGSIGSEIVRQVAQMDAKEIVLVDQAETPMHDLQLELEGSFPNIVIRLCIADVADPKRMEKIFKDFGPRIVYHAAAYKHVPMMERNPSEAIKTNVFGTKLLADLSLKYGVEKFVMVSTDKAVNPTNVMGASKRIAEIYVQSLALKLKREDSPRATKFITTRFGNVLGSNGSVIPLFRRQIEAGGPVTVTHRDIIRYFMTIPEACSLVLEAGCMGHGGEIFIFDMGEPVKIYDLATRMISLAGLDVVKDIQIVETGLRPGEKLYEELLNTKELTTATMHKKIMVAKVRMYDYNEVLEALGHLLEAVDRVDFHDIVANMKRIVPEFVSQNSKWHQVDEEVVNDPKMTEVKDCR